MNIAFQQVFSELQKLAAKEVQRQSEPEGNKGFLNNLVQQKDEQVVKRYIRAALNEIQRYLSAAISSIAEGVDGYTIKWTKSYTDRADNEDLQRLIIDCILDAVMCEWVADDKRTKDYADALARNLPTLARMVYAMPLPKPKPKPIDEISIRYDE